MYLEITIMRWFASLDRRYWVVDLELEPITKDTKNEVCLPLSVGQSNICE